MSNQFLESLSTQSSHSFQLGDKRIDRRAEYITEKMMQNNGKSLPQIFCAEADLKGAYRFFSNNFINPKKILEPHQKETVARCKQQKTVLVIQDSSDLDFDYMECLDGFESLHVNIDKGFRIHPVLATTETGTPLGVIATFNYTRKQQQTDKHRNSLPIEEKESFRWLQGYREACNLAVQSPETEVICLSDSECDIYECFMEATEAGLKADILTRAQHNRTIIEEDKNISKIEKKLIRCPVIYEGKISLNQ